MGGDAQAKHINMEKTHFARSGTGVGRSEAERQPSSLVRAAWDRDPAGPGAAPGSGQGETPAETPGSGLAASAGRAAGGRGGSGGFLRISQARGKPL